MRIIMTLSEILDRCNWDKFCAMSGMSEYAVNEGGGDIEYTLSESEACEIGLKLRNNKE